MPDNKPKAIREYERRITGEYIANQVVQRRQAERHSEHKTRIEKGDRIYRGDLSDFRTNGDPAPKDHLLIENKYKNSLHDLTRLAAEPRPVPVFVAMGDSVEEAKKARVREAIADTIWEFGINGPRIQRKLYMDLVGAGYMAVQLFYNDKSEYAQGMRLDPRYCYPEVRNGTLQSMLYVETMNAALAKAQWPDLAESITVKDDKDVEIATYADDKVVSQAIVQMSGNKPVKNGAFVVQEWKHDLKCVPVAFVTLDTFDSTYRGLLDQVGGPMALRNRIMAYLNDYVEEMVHAPFEAKNVLNADDPPGPLTIYEHDPHADDSFIRRVAPAAPAGSVFGVLQYMDAQESMEALQPPSRVGNVRQSIASGDFVNSTQGNLSSAVRELQDCMADLRRQVHYIAFKIEEHYLDNEKPLIRAIERKKTYKPSRDIDGVYTHRILFGASAGMDRQYADVRVIQHAGAGFISKKTARSQLDYLDDPTSEQNWIDQEQIAAVLLQRMTADPATPLSIIAKTLMGMAKGNDLVEVMMEQAEAIAAKEAELQQQAAGEQLPTGAAPVDAEEERLALEKGATGEGAPVAPIKPFSPPPLAQVFID